MKKLTYLILALLLLSCSSKGGKEAEEDSVVVEVEVEISTLDELEEASPKAEIIEKNDSVAIE